MFTQRTCFRSMSRRGDCLRPSLFGAYPVIPRGVKHRVQLGGAAPLVSVKDEWDFTKIIVEEGDSAQSFSFSTGMTSTQLTADLVSKWIRYGQPRFEDVESQSVAAFALSQAGYNMEPYWENAQVSARQWEYWCKLSNAHQHPAMKLLECIAFDTSLIPDMMKGNLSVIDYLSGVHGALEGFPEHVVSSIIELTSRIAAKPGLLVVSDRSFAHDVLDEAERSLDGVGWVVTCGRRPVERLVYREAISRGIPAFTMSNSGEIRPHLLSCIGHVLRSGRESQWGVLRNKLLREVSEPAMGGEA